MTIALDQTPDQPARKRLLGQIVLAVAAGTVITVLVVLPAEYGIDPTGFGTLTGLTRISAPLETVIETTRAAPLDVVRSEELPFRTDTITITVPPIFESMGAIEYKVTMREGDSVVYSWTAPADVLYEFHGHTEATADNPTIDVMDYIKGTASGDNGTLNAPINGIHGWYFAQSGYEPLEVTLHLAGFYELTPGLMTMRPSE